MAKVMDSDSPEKSIFLIDSRLYNHRLHSKQSKAALLLHETIYRVARKFSHATNSDASRRGVGLFLRQKLMAGEFNQKILDLGLADDFFKGELPADELTALSLGMPSRLDMHSLAKQSQFNTCVWADTVEAYSLWINWSSDPHANRPCTNEDRANVITQLLDYFDSNYSFEQLQGLRSYLSDSQIKEFISVIRKRIANNMDADGHELISTITRQAYLERRGQVTPQLPESYTKGSVFWMDILAFRYRLATDAELNAIRDLNQISI